MLLWFSFVLYFLGFWSCFRTPPVISIHLVGVRTLYGAPPHCAVWPRPRLQGVCRQTWSSPTVPHTFPAAFTAHQVSTFNRGSGEGGQSESSDLEIAFVFAWLFLVVQEGRGRPPPAPLPPLPRHPPSQMTSPSSPYQPAQFSPALQERYSLSTPSACFYFKLGTTKYKCFY